MRLRYFVVAEFLLTSASRGPSAIAEPLVYNAMGMTHSIEWFIGGRWGLFCCTLKLIILLVLITVTAKYNVITKTASFTVSYKKRCRFTSNYCSRLNWSTLSCYYDQAQNWLPWQRLLRYQKRSRSIICTQNAFTGVKIAKIGPADPQIICLREIFKKHKKEKKERN